MITCSHIDSPSALLNATDASDTQFIDVLIENNQKKVIAEYVVQQYLQEVMGEEKNEDKIEDTMSLLSLLARCLCLLYYRILLRFLEAPK